MLHGAEMVATGAIAAAARAEESRLALVDGAVGIVFAPAGQLRIVLALTVSDARQITTIDVIADPDRLRRCGWRCCRTRSRNSGAGPALLFAGPGLAWPGLGRVLAGVLAGVLAAAGLAVVAAQGPAGAFSQMSGKSGRIVDPAARRRPC